MKKPVIMIDLDLTLYDTDVHWNYWMLKHSLSWDSVSFIFDTKLKRASYNPSCYYTFPEGFNTLAFWERNSTYEECDSLPNAIRIITELHERGFDIVFGSYCMGCEKQAENKAQRLRKDFGHIDYRFYPLDDKGSVECNIIIDDRNFFLSQTSDDVIKIKMRTQYTQDVPADFEHIECRDWVHIKNVINKLIEEGEFS